MAVCLLTAALGVCAQAQEQDSLRVINLQEVEVISTRATNSTPVAFTNIGKEQLKKQNFGQDLPYLLSMTPSAITTSDAGAGVGYTTLRVRGTDGTRINVTANGIPINDAESHTVFWVNLPDFASSVKDMQVQRGAGTSTNGAGAFGASINMQTGDFSMKPYAEFNGSYGSFHTHKETVKVGTGLINNHWSFDARLSNISTDGYIDRASVGLNSYYLQGGYYNDNTSVKLITFAGKERTYHAWNYASKEEMERYGRRYNSCGFMYATDRDGHVYSKEYYKDDNGEKHYLTDEGGALHFYDDQTDNYTQKNYQLLFNHNFTSQWNLNIGLHYTKGDGYYQEYKGERSLTEYGMSPFEYNGGKVEVSDLIRKKAMDNWFGGGIFSVSYKADRLHASLGGALNRYDGDHFGKVLWVKNYIGELNPDHDYYRNNATKNSNFFSRDCMVQALIQLLKTKSLSNITITELTERAGVSRMTYYRNYHSLDDIFSSYLKDLVESYRQDVATWPDKGNYNDSRNMLHCYEYFNHYKEFIACLVQTGLGHLLLQALDGYILDTYYTEDKGQDFYYTLRAFSGSLYNIYVTWILEDSKESAEEIVSIIRKIYS